MELKFSYDDCFQYTVIDSIDVERVRTAAEQGKILRVKLGIDPTSPHIHLGRAIPLWRLRAFQEMGHHIDLVVGDFTGQVGDTSDKEAERPMLEEATIRENMARYEEQLWMVLNHERKDQVHFHHNSEWLSKLSFAEVGTLADAFSVNQFIKRELIARRLEAGSRVSLREMLYPVMQGYDSVHLESDIELGGTDQRFNLLAGRTLQEQAGKVPQALLMNQLISGLDGRKMSSSFGNGIFLLDSPADKFGKFMTVRDDLLAEYLFVFPQSAQPFSKEELQQRLDAGENPRDIKLQAAERLVALYHGEDKAREVREAYIQQFSEHKLPENIEEVSIEDFRPSPDVDMNTYAHTLVHILVALHAAESNTQARTLIKGGGVRYGGEVIRWPEENSDIAPHIVLKKDLVLQVGPRRFWKFV